MSNFKQSDNLHILTKLGSVYLLDKVKIVCFPGMFLKDKFVGFLICQSEIGVSEQKYKYLRRKLRGKKSL